MIGRFTSNIITGQYIYIYVTFLIVFIVQSFTQVKNYITLLAAISSFSFGFSVNSNLIHPNSKMTAKNYSYRQAGTHICCGFTVNDLIM